MAVGPRLRKKKRIATAMPYESVPFCPVRAKARRRKNGINQDSADCISHRDPIFRCRPTCLVHDKPREGSSSDRCISRLEPGLVTHRRCTCGAFRLCDSSTIARRRAGRSDSLGMRAAQGAIRFSARRTTRRSVRRPRVPDSECLVSDGPIQPDKAWRATPFGHGTVSRL